jgi:hypothetical protein
MLSPWLANTMIGARIALRLTKRPGSSCRLAARQLVADEELLDDPADLGLVHPEIAAPPFLELEETVLARVDGAEQVVILTTRNCARGSGTRNSAPDAPSNLPPPEVGQIQRRQHAAHQPPL